MNPMKIFLNLNKYKTNLLLVLTFFSIFIILSSSSIDAFTWNRPTIIEATLNVNHSETSNSSDFWNDLDDPSDINTADLTDDNTYVEVAGDSMTGNLEIDDAGDDTSIILHGGDTNLNASIIFQEVSLDRWSLLFSGLNNNFYLWNDALNSPTWMANLVNNAMTFYGNTTIHGDLLPGSSLIYDIGSGALRWNVGYFANLSVEYIETYNIDVLENLTVDGYINGMNISNGLINGVNVTNHALLDNLAWSVAGHTIDTDLDMDNNNIDNIDKAYFGTGAFISSDDNKHIDIHSDYIDLHGNLSTIWNIILTDSDGTTAHNNLMFGGQHDAWIYYNASDLIIDPDVVGDGIVYIDGNISADNLDTGLINGINISNLSNVYVPYSGAINNVDLGSYNFSTDGFLIDSLDVASIDMDNRRLFAQDGEDIILDYFILGKADFGNSNVYTTENSTARWFKGKFNWTSGDTWNSFDGSTLTFNESKLSTIYYNATQSEVVTGTIDGGTLVDTQHPDGNYDGTTFNFTEAS